MKLQKIKTVGFYFLIYICFSICLGLILNFYKTYEEVGYKFYYRKLSPFNLEENILLGFILSTLIYFFSYIFILIETKQESRNDKHV